VFRAHADRLSYQTTAAFNYRDLYYWRHSIRPASPPCRGRYTPTHGWGPDATGLDTTMLIFTGSRERTESEYQDLLHRAGLTLAKTTATASPLSIFRPHLPKTDSASGFPERN
jgi:hypothetical protein